LFLVALGRGARKALLTRLAVEDALEDGVGLSPVVTGGETVVAEVVIHDECGLELDGLNYVV
jgi:hypothetical protein